MTDSIFTENLAVAIDKSGPEHAALLYEIDQIIGEMHEDGTLTDSERAVVRRGSDPGADRIAIDQSATERGCLERPRSPLTEGATKQMATKARTQDRAPILDADRRRASDVNGCRSGCCSSAPGSSSSAHFIYALWVTDNIDTAWWTEWGPYIVGGTWITLVVCLSSIVFASILAILGALSRLSGNPIPNGIASLYVSLFRGTPLLVQIFFIYFALPQVGITIPSIPAGILALSLNYGAYMTEIFRAGIQAVPPGQREAAEALGMPERLVFRRVVLPQAFRIVIPAVGNDFIAMIKDSALVSTIAVQELLWRARTVGTQDFRTLQAFLIAAVMYWGLTIIFSFFQDRLERRMARGDR